MHGVWEEPSHVKNLEWLKDDPVRISFEQGTIVTRDVALLGDATYGGGSNVFLSSESKVFMLFDVSLHHMILDSMAVALHELMTRPGEHFVVVLPGNSVRSMMVSNTVQLLEDFTRIIADFFGVKTSIVSIDEQNFIVANNCTVLSRLVGTAKTTREIAQFFADYAAREDLSVSGRKIYISRNRTYSNYELPFELGMAPENPEIQEKYRYKINDRIDDEKLFEDFLESLGFEIVCAEEIESLEDRLELFSSVKCVASVTGAGLTNLIFMPEGSTVIEFYTPLEMRNYDGALTKSIHPNYQVLSAVTNKNYLAIPNNRVASDLITYLESKPELLQLIKDS